MFLQARGPLISACRFEKRIAQTQRAQNCSGLSATQRFAVFAATASPSIRRNTVSELAIGGTSASNCHEFAYAVSMDDLTFQAAVLISTAMFAVLLLF